MPQPASRSCERGSSEGNPNRFRQFGGDALVYFGGEACPLVFRNAAAFGAGGVVLSPACADPWYRKAIRTSMAAVLRVPFAYADAWPGDLARLRQSGFTLVALTGVVLVSAALRLRLYQEAYGWTELRFYVYAAIGWLGLGLAALAALLGRDRMRWLAHALGVAALVVVVALNAIGPTAVRSAALGNMWRMP